MHSAVAPLPTDPEIEAREALSEGDVRRATTLLMTAYGDAIYRHCWSVLGDHSLADDVHQTVFVQAYRDLAGWQGRSTLRTWLYSIARHRCLDALKSRRRRWRRFVLTKALPEQPAEQPEPGWRIARSAELVALEQALASLKPQVRIAVLLRYREEMSFEQMAEICGERPATLQARVARALPRLRQALEQGGER